jgi:hypothetical protein
MDEVSKPSIHNHDDENVGALWGASGLGIMRDSRPRSRMRGSDGSQAVCRRGDLAASRNAKRSRDIGIIRLSQPLRCQPTLILLHELHRLRMYFVCNFAAKCALNGEVQFSLKPRHLRPAGYGYGHMCTLRKWGEALRTEMGTPRPADQYSPEYLCCLDHSTLLYKESSSEDCSCNIILEALHFSPAGSHTVHLRAVQFCTPAHTSR